MRLSDLSIRNPVFAVMLTAAMMIFGYLGYRDLGVSQFPEIEFPVVSINTTREGSPPEVMDYDVTDIIEDAISGVEGIDYVQSNSTYNGSNVSIYFRVGRDVDAAVQDVQNAVAGVASRLPADVDPPIISKVNMNRFPILWLAVHGPVTLRELNSFVDDTLKKQMQTIPGVGSVVFGGLRVRNMRIWLDRDRLQALKLDAVDVFDALQHQHVELPAGYLASDSREINVRFKGEAVTPDEFRALPILQRQGMLIRLGDVAIVEDGMADRRAFARFNGETNVGVGIMRANGANVVEACDAVKARLADLRKLAPPGIDIHLSSDYSLYIKEDIAEVKKRAHSWGDSYCYGDVSIHGQFGNHAQCVHFHSCLADWHLHCYPLAKFLHQFHDVVGIITLGGGGGG